MDDVNVLIIEDKKEDAVFLQETLKDAGYKVWCCANGEEGMRLVQTTPFAAVLTELLTPGMNGEEIAEQVLAINPAIGVVVMTTVSFISSAVEAMEAGAYGYVSKPFNASEIKIVLKRAVERFQLLGSSKKKDQFAEMSVKDGLTGLYNRRFLDVFMRKKLSFMEQESEKFSILMLDIDYFKKYNDTNGHSAGDQLLREAAKVYQKAVRKDDVVFRYGGEEFLVFLEYADKKGARIIAERILTSFSLYLPATVSIGVGTYPEDGQVLDDLLKKADAALYKAKENGRNQVCLA